MTMEISEIYQLKSCVQNIKFNIQHDIVLLTFDDGYVAQSINLMLSLIKNHSSNLSFVCACLGLSQQNVEKLLKFDFGVRICTYEMIKYINVGRWSPNSLLRVFSPWLIEDINKILYIDSDVLCTGNIQDLFDLDVNYIAMSNEISGNVSESREATYRKICPTHIYCNAGVTLINTERIRQEFPLQEIYDSCRYICENYPYIDQDFLNVFFVDKIQYINGFRYNFQAYELLGSVMYKKTLKQSRLIHFSCGKPWNCNTDRRIIKLYLDCSEYDEMKVIIKKVLFKNSYVRHFNKIKKAMDKIRTYLG